MAPCSSRDGITAEFDGLRDCAPVLLILRSGVGRVSSKLQTALKHGCCLNSDKSDKRMNYDTLAHRSSFVGT